MRTIKITVAYDGRNFHGWQIQPGAATIQGALVDILGTITQEKIFLHGASRTDTGVHALGQVAAFRTQSALSAMEFQRALNAMLPPAIRIVKAEECGPDFHPRWIAESKTYHYRIFRGRVLSPFEYGRVLHYPWPLDEEAMMKAARYFEGEQDFSSFAAAADKEDERNPIRTILRSEILRRPVPPAGGIEPQTRGDVAIQPDEDHELLYVVHGKSFLRYMVRKIVGTLLDVGRGRIEAEKIPEIFARKDRTFSGPTSAPEGLYLISIEYPEVWTGDVWREGSRRENAAASVSPVSMGNMEKNRI